MVHAMNNATGVGKTIFARRVGIIYICTMVLVLKRLTIELFLFFLQPFVVVPPTNAATRSSGLVPLAVPPGRLDRRRFGIGRQCALVISADVALAGASALRRRHRWVPSPL